MDELILFLQNQDVEFYRNKSLRQMCSIGIGGTADLFIVPDGIKKTVALLNFLSSTDFKYRVVGNMTNILPADHKVESILISTSALKRISFDKNLVFAECGASFSSLLIKAANKSLGGLESLFGIPGTVGGMLYMNAGAYGHDISERLLDVDVYCPIDNSLKRISSKKLYFSYRDSRIKRDKLIVLSARFAFDTGEREQILESLQNIKNLRRDTQPLSRKSVGSVFKRCGDYSASYLIDKCGLKGTAVGGVMVSQKHAGFFINTGNGTASDFLELCDTVKNKVQEKYGVLLSEEFEYLQ